MGNGDFRGIFFKNRIPRIVIVKILAIPVLTRFIPRT
jgi:hypothetical protein